MNDPTFGTSSVVGRYFGVVSTLPSAILTAWLYTLATVRPWREEPILDQLLPGGPTDQLARSAILIAVALTIAVASHPLQFVLVQLFEGYWGRSQAARALAAKRILVHLQARDAADRLLDQAGTEWSQSAEDLLAGAAFRNPDNQLAIRKTIQQSADRRSAAMAFAQYPRASQAMPTRLGNILKTYESLAGAAVGLDLVQWASHIGMVADAGHTAYVQDQRQRLDLAVRMAAVGLVCTVFTALATWPHGVWVLATLAPFGMTWLSYRGALAAAASYGQALTAWLHLNRFQLYERLGLDKPASSSDERVLTMKLAALRRGSPTYNQNFSRPAGEPSA